MSAFGLCDRCAHQRMWGNRRGSTFSMCGRAKADERFPKYPRMPVVRCAGFEERPAGSEAPRAAGA